MSDQAAGDDQVIDLDVSRSVWDRFFTVAPLTLVGTIEEDGSADLAPKHRAMPLGWSNYFFFVCSPRHRTQENAMRTGFFTVSFPRPDQVVEISMAAAPREEGEKSSLAAIPTFPARVVEGVLVKGAYLWLECRLDRVIEDYGDDSLIIGEVVAASVSEKAMRDADGDDADLLRSDPLLAYVSSGRFARVDETFSFPFHAGFRP